MRSRFAIGSAIVLLAVAAASTTACEDKEAQRNAEHKAMEQDQKARAEADAKKKKDDEEAKLAAAAASAAASASAGAAAGAVAEFHLAATGITMAYDVTRITAKTGQKVHITFENKKPGELPHNWALVMPGKEASVAAAGLAKGEGAGWIAEGPDLLAYTATVKPGTSAEVTFVAPAVGKYPYICTFPGHYIMMKGVLDVTP